MNLDIELITGDINQVESLDFLLLGYKNPLREKICKQTNSVFQSIDNEGWSFPHQYELLTHPSYKWKKVAAIKFRSNGKVHETQFARISSPLSTAIKQPNVKSIGILPPTWRNPSYCALGVIYSLWLIGYVHACSINYRHITSETIKQLYPNPSGVKFKIVTLNGIEHFEKVMQNDYEIMWDFLKQLGNKQQNNLFKFSYKRLRKTLVIFNVTKTSV